MRAIALLADCGGVDGRVRAVVLLADCGGVDGVPWRAGCSG
ncbi:hypothetical protein [Nonomuraea maritima]|nr:hypothetical protein [Nonomuraea maritima]